MPRYFAGHSRWPAVANRWTEEPQPGFGRSGCLAMLIELQYKWAIYAGVCIFLICGQPKQRRGCCGESGGGESAVIRMIKWDFVCMLVCVCERVLREWNLISRMSEFITVIWWYFVNRSSNNYAQDKYIKRMIDLWRRGIWIGLSAVRT